jgi:hypothetical protein
MRSTFIGIQLIGPVGMVIGASLAMLTAWLESIVASPFKIQKDFGAFIEMTGTWTTMWMLLLIESRSVGDSEAIRIAAPLL